MGYAFPENSTFEAGGRRSFLSGPFETGFGMLITPTCSLRSQPADAQVPYSHEVRTLVPILPFDDEKFVKAGILNADAIKQVRTHDSAINYMYLPALSGVMPEGLALLYMPLTMHHDVIDGNRVAQLSLEGARQLHRKLVRFYSGWEEGRDFFQPPMD